MRKFTYSQGVQGEAEGNSPSPLQVEYLHILPPHRSSHHHLLLDVEARCKGPRIGHHTALRPTKL